MGVGDGHRTPEILECQLCHPQSPFDVKIPRSFFLVGLVLGPRLAKLRAYFWLCSRETILAVLRGPYETLGIGSGSAACKVSTISAVLSILNPQFLVADGCVCVCGGGKHPLKCLGLGASPTLCPASFILGVLGVEKGHAHSCRRHLAPNSSLSGYLLPSWESHRSPYPTPLVLF